MEDNKHVPFDLFLVRMVNQDNLSYEHLIELVGQATAEKIWAVVEKLKRNQIQGAKKDVLAQEKKDKQRRKKATKENHQKAPVSNHKEKRADKHAGQDIGRETANRVLDNANNWIGAPALGSSTAVILHGQLHKFAGAINDIKGQISDKINPKPVRSEASEPAEPRHQGPRPR